MPASSRAPGAMRPDLLRPDGRADPDKIARRARELRGEFALTYPGATPAQVAEKALRHVMAQATAQAGGRP